MGDKCRHRKTDRQTNKQTNRQTTKKEPKCETMEDLLSWKMETNTINPITDMNQKYSPVITVI